MWQNKREVMLFTIIIVLGIALLVSVVACGSLSGGRPVKTQQANPSSEQPGGVGQGQISNTNTLSPSGKVPTVASSPPSTPENMTGTASSALTAQLEIPTEAQLGEPVPLKFRLRNTSNRPVELYLGGRPPHDFVVTTKDVKEIWSWLHGKNIQLILESKTLNPGEELEFDAEWQQVNNSGDLIPPGTYWVKGVLNLNPPVKLETQPKQLIITSR